MSISVMADHLVAFSEAKTLPGSPTYWTLFKWAKYGYPVRKKGEIVDRVFLEKTYIGRTPYTSVAAFVRFQKQLNEARKQRETGG